MRLEELCRVEAVSIELVRSWVVARWVLPLDREGIWVFSTVDRARVRLIRELRDDVGIQDSALPVVLSLLDRVHHLRHRLGAITLALGDEPEDVRRRLLDRLGGELLADDV